jgi:hypothetical protein
MATDKHYFIEEDKKGRYAVRAKGAMRATALVDTQEEAIQEVKKLNPDDHPDVARVQNRKKGPDKWRSSR